MPTTSLGFRYPAGTDYAGTGADVPRAVGELAADLNTFLTGKYCLIKITNIFTGTVSYTPQTGVTGLYVEMVGGGGGGGGCVTGVTNSAAGGGGGSGGYSAIWTTTIKTFTVAVGAGGTGVSGASGNTGGNTTFDSPSICSANGGSGGSPHTVAVPPVVGGVGGSGGPSVTGDLLANGQAGGNGFTLAAAQAMSGAGGASQWAGGANSVVSNQNGNNAGLGYGGGGSGAVILSGGITRTGGNGGNGLIRVWEFQST
jgi:hypothetical protein